VRPELFTLPGALLAVVAPLLILWGAASLFLYAVFVRGRPAPEQPPTAPDGAPRWRIVVDNPLNAALTIVAGVLLARFGSSEAHAFRDLLALRAWTAPYRAIPMHSYGVLLGLSLVAGWNLTLPLAARLGLAREQAADCYVITAAAAVAGSRVLYVLTNLSEFVDPSTGSLSWPAVVSLRTGGLVAYGGFLGGFLGSAGYLRRRGLSLRAWADAAVPSVVLGLAMTRVGCFLYGCDFGCVLPRGAPSFVLRAGTFPRWADGRGSPAWEQHTLDGFRTDAARCVQQFNGDFHDGLCRLGANATASAPVHPTQLYESAVAWILLAALWVTWRRRRFDGQLLLVTTAGYGLARAAIEVLRDDRGRGSLAGLSTSQWIGLTTALLAGILWRRWSANPTLTPERPPEHPSVSPASS
jgi:phosphatidylglycerol:prolipoprotein diacylglycerol transferase